METGGAIRISDDTTHLHNKWYPKPINLTEIIKPTMMVEANPPIMRHFRLTGTLALS
jgi:hypothetical protein